MWNYHDEDVPAPASELAIEVAGIAASTAHLTEYRMDAEHSNAYATWIQMGRPQHPSNEQIETLRKTGGLATVREQEITKGKAAPLRFPATLPRQAVALYRVTW